MLDIISFFVGYTLGEALSCDSKTSTTSSSPEDLSSRNHKKREILQSRRPEAIPFLGENHPCHQWTQRLRNLTIQFHSKDDFIHSGYKHCTRNYVLEPQSRDEFFQSHCFQMLEKRLDQNNSNCREQYATLSSGLKECLKVHP